MEASQKNSISLIFGYFFIGLLIGYISGLTSSEVTKTILTTLLAFIGGKVLTDIGKKSHQQLSQIGYILTAFSVSFLLGLNGGICVKVNQLLTWKSNDIVSQHADKRTNKKSSINEYMQYMRADDSVRRDVKTRYLKGEITKDSIVNLYFKESNE